MKEESSDMAHGGSCTPNSRRYVDNGTPNSWSEIAIAATGASASSHLAILLFEFGGGGREIGEEGREFGMGGFDISARGRPSFSSLSFPPLRPPPPPHKRPFGSARRKEEENPLPSLSPSSRRKYPTTTKVQWEEVKEDLFFYIFGKRRYFSAASGSDLCGNGGADQLKRELSPHIKSKLTSRPAGGGVVRISVGSNRWHNEQFFATANGERKLLSVLHADLLFSPPFL